ncbi:N-methyl-L-tryptophan oxidase [Phytohabitans rumicis]|uniref:N-methyltryptophan oxidase n=1 Tax=Phytohabitans rumicis TaxID=1076125 RepID=A0A6V8LJR1_9ACTN|nr:N-methyl-L-tryptophan oxidase [Phytohabitans rumicis]GFJ94859.1 N-methyltryptophan oxidase [Phytohabitans rumicis]
MQDVIVVGGGAMGSATAWALATAGRDVHLLERFEPGHDRGGSHGATRIFRLVYAEPDYVTLAQRALRLWRDLEEESGTPLLTTTGGIDHGPAALGVADVLTAHGVPFTVLDAASASRRWPGMAFDSPVLHQPDGGRLLADAAIQVLQRLATSTGALIEHGRQVTGIAVRGDDDVEVRTAEGMLRARHVVVAAGGWAPGLLRGIADLPPLRVTQEEPAHFQALDGDATWPSFIHWRPDHDAYGLLTPGEGVKVGFHGTGPVVDPDRRDYTPTEEGSRMLRDYVRRWLPGLDPDTATPISCLYDNTASSDFVLDRVGPVTVTTGFSGHGFKFVPAIGRIVADLVTGAAPAPARFSLAAHA